MLKARREFALNIGLALLRFNEIDWMTQVIQIQILQKTITKTWVKKPSKERIQGLLKDLDGCANSSPELLQTLKNAESLCDIRNEIAHGSFILIPCDSKILSESEFATLKLGSDLEPLKASSLKQYAEELRDCSNSMSECIAICKMKMNHLGNV